MLIVGLLLMTAVCIWAWMDTKKSKRALKATYADCDADNDLMNWKFANPSIGIGDSDYACSLVRRCIATWREFLETHPYIKDNSRTAFLYSLLDQRGSPPPGKPKNIIRFQTTSARGRFYFSINHCTRPTTPSVRRTLIPRG